MLNLDTHILIHAMAGSLSEQEERILRNHPWGISSIVLWEIGKLHQKGRINIGLDHPRLLSTVNRVRIWDLSAEVCRVATSSLDFQSDPADELIAATSIVHGVPLVTRDSRILASRLVQFAT